MHGLMGLASVVDDQAPVRLGALAEKDPILSTASVMASSIMLRMASVPKDKRVAEMVSILDAAQPGLGARARADFLKRVARAAPSARDQSMFDALRVAIADTLVERTLRLASGVAGLGQTVAEVQGRTSRDVDNAQALFCSYGAGTTALVMGSLAQFNVGGSSSQAGVTGAQAGATIAGCNAGQMLIQGQNAIEQARLSQSGTAQELALQQAREERLMKFALVGGGALVTLAVVAKILLKP